MGGFGPAITATIGADVGPLNSAGPRVESAAGNIATKMERRLLGSAHVSQALATSFGLNIEKLADHVAGLVFGVTEKAKKAWEELGESGARVLEILEAQFAARRGDSQAAAAAEEKLASLKRQSIALLAEEEKWNGKIAKLRAATGAETYIGSRLILAAESERLLIQNKLAANQAEQQKAGAALDTAATRAQQELGRLEQSRFEKSIKSLPLQQQILALATREFQLSEKIDAFKGKGVDLDLLKKNLAETTAAIEEAHQKRREEGDKRALEIDQESFEHQKAHHEQLVLEAKLKTGTILPAEKARLDVIRLQVKEAVLQHEMAMLLEKPLKSWTQQDKERFAVLQRQTKQIETQIGLITNPPMPPPEDTPVIKTIESYISKWREFIGVITTTGRGDKDLSPGELARKIQNIKNDIFQRKVANPGQPDFLLDPQRNNLSQALAEQSFRATVQRDNAAFGRERAQQLHPGLNDQRFEEIVKSGKDANDKLTASVDKLQRGIDGLTETIRIKPYI